MLFQRWIKYGVLSSAFLVLPMQSVFASGAQWRPVNSVSPGSYAVDGRLQQSAAHIRFRPVNHLRRPAPLPSLSGPVAPQPPMRPAMPQQPPAFARQFAWRPAPTHWLPHSGRGNSAYTARNQGGSNNRPVRGGWRPVAGMPVHHQDMRSVTVPAQYPGNWRPVGNFGNRAESASSSEFVYRSANEPAPYQAPATPLYRQPLHAAYPYPSQPYMMPMAGAYLPPPPMPYMHAPHYGMHYPGYPPVMPQAPVWGWQPPMPIPAYPPMYPPQRPGLQDGASLAGCPSC